MEYCYYVGVYEAFVDLMGSCVMWLIALLPRVFSQNPNSVFGKRKETFQIDRATLTMYYIFAKIISCFWI